MPNSAPPKAIPCRSRHFQVKPQFTHPRGYALFTAVLLGPNNTVFVLVTYMTGLFFLLGPYATMLVYQSEAYPTECRATGGAFAFAMSQPGAILGGLFLTIATAAGLNYTMAALVVGSGACLISGIIMISARTPPEVTLNGCIWVTRGGRKGPAHCTGEVSRRPRFESTSAGGDAN